MMSQNIATSRTWEIRDRLATVRNATRILVLKAGHIVETGTYDELIKAGGFFAEFAGAQFPAEAEEKIVVPSP